MLNSMRGALSAKAFGAFAPHGIVEPTTDPYWANVRLLVQMIGAEGSTSFVDAKGHTITKTGNPHMTTAAPLYDTSSAIFTQSTPDYLTVAASADFVHPGDVTIEFTYKVGVSGGQQQIIGNLTGNTALHWALRSNGANNSVVWWANGLTGSAGSFGIYTVGQILKIALVRSAGNCTVFVNGTAVGTVLAFAGTMGSNTLPLAIGAVPNATLPFGGMIDEIRITDGIARYTANYVPRITRFPTS